MNESVFDRFKKKKAPKSITDVWLVQPLAETVEKEPTFALIRAKRYIRPDNYQMGWKDVYYAFNVEDIIEPTLSSYSSLWGGIDLQGKHYDCIAAGTDTEESYEINPWEYSTLKEAQKGILNLLFRWKPMSWKAWMRLWNDDISHSS